MPPPASLDVHAPTEGVDGGSEGPPAGADRLGPAWLDGWRRYAILLGVALVVRLVYWLVLTPDYVPDSDADQYLRLARNLADGEGFALVFPQLELHPTAFRPPLYPALLGTVFLAVGDSIVAGRLLNLVLGLGVVVLTDRLGARLGGPVAGFTAAAPVALSIPMAANDVVLPTEPLSLVLLAGTLVLLLDRHPHWAGLTSGLLVLTRPSAQGVALALGAWIWWRFGWRRAAAFVAIVAVVVAPWIVRNSVQVGTTSLVTSNGFNLAAIYSPEADADDDFVDPFLDERFDDLRLLQFDEAAWSDELAERGLESLRADPSQVVEVVWRNLDDWFELDPAENERAGRSDGRHLGARRWGLPLFYVTTVVGLAGLWVARHRRGVALLALVGAYFTATSLVFLAAPRLRAPFDLVCCLGAGLAVPAFAERRRHQKGQRDRQRARAVAQR